MLSIGEGFLWQNAVWTLWVPKRRSGGAGGKRRGRSEEARMEMEKGKGICIYIYFHEFGGGENDVRVGPSGQGLISGSTAEIVRIRVNS